MGYQSEMLISEPVSSNENIALSANDLYESLLEKNGLKKNKSGLYWQAGSIHGIQGWILHLAVVKHQLPDLATIVIPFLLEKRVAFKVPQSLEQAGIINEGGMGYNQLAKMISIYPDHDEQALTIAKELIELTKSFNGPNIPTDICLGSIVNTRYGSFNPILIKDGADRQHKYIYDHNGNLICDPYSIPFRMPEGVKWPFNNLASPETPVEPRLLNFRYFPVNIIKADAKGNVSQAIYFERFWKIKSCIIKEGRKNMFSDDYGRDIRDRLEWQHTLHKALQEWVPIPRVIDFFHYKDKSFLVLELVKGVSLSDWIEKSYNYRIWRDLPLKTKQLFLELSLNIIDIIHSLHRKGYLHRDLNPGNFLINKQGKITLIDLELTWSSNENHPSPAFGLGTPGFMSPEQELSKFPAIAQDTYSLGAFLVNLFSNLNPIKLHFSHIDKVTEALEFLTGDKEFAEIIERCVDKSPDQRPSLPNIKRTISAFRDRLSLEKIIYKSAAEDVFYDSSNLESALKLAVQSMGQPEFLSPEGLWLSTESRIEKYIVNQQHDLTVKVGWHIGLSGPIWLFASLKNAGYPLEGSTFAFERSLDYIKNYLEHYKDEHTPGLYGGNAGVAMALSSSMQAGLIKTDDENSGYLAQCFLLEAPLGGLRFGLAGQGIALLSARPSMPPDSFEYLLNQYIERFLRSQSRDGSWIFLDKNEKGNAELGLSRGVAGACWFLLACLTLKSHDAAIRLAIERSLTWLTRETSKARGMLRGMISNGNLYPDYLNTGHGMTGIILTFIKAYEMLGNEDYKTICESWLEQLPERFFIADFTLYSGLAGLGELYLDAARVFREQTWTNRAAWLAKFFGSSIQKGGNGSNFWVSGDLTNVTMDLFFGNSGIIHFLMGNATPMKHQHPFWPIEIK